VKAGVRLARSVAVAACRAGESLRRTPDDAERMGADAARQLAGGGGGGWGIYTRSRLRNRRRLL